MLSFVTPIFHLYYREASSNDADGLNIGVTGEANAQVIVKGKVTLNSNGGDGMYSSLNPNTKLEINVESGATLNSCGNSVIDIGGEVEAPSTLTFLGTGYTCEQTKVLIIGTVDEPVCQSCT